MDINLIATLFALGFMAGDIVSGILKAAKEGNVSSAIFREGLWHKSGFAGLIALAFGIQYALVFMDLGFVFPAVEVICGMIVICEIISIYENLCVLNPQLKEKRFSQIFAEVPRDATNAGQEVINH